MRDKPIPQRAWLISLFYFLRRFTMTQLFNSAASITANLAGIMLELNNKKVDFERVQFLNELTAPKGSNVNSKSEFLSEFTSIISEQDFFEFESLFAESNGVRDVFLYRGVKMTHYTEQDGFKPRSYFICALKDQSFEPLCQWDKKVGEFYVSSDPYGMHSVYDRFEQMMCVFHHGAIENDEELLLKVIDFFKIKYLHITNGTSSFKEGDTHASIGFYQKTDTGSSFVLLATLSNSTGLMSAHYFYELVKSTAVCFEGHSGVYNAISTQAREIVILNRQDTEDDIDI
jgi:hypothetical protein